MGILLRGDAGQRLIPITNSDFVVERESESDMLALGYMMNAGYDPQALVSIFDRLAANYRSDEKVRAKAAALSNAAAVTILNTSAFDQIKAHLMPPTRRVPTLFK